MADIFMGGNPITTYTSWDDPLSKGWNPLFFLKPTPAVKTSPPGGALQEGAGKSLRDLVRKKKNGKGSQRTSRWSRKTGGKEMDFFVGRDRGEFSVNNHIPF